MDGRQIQNVEAHRRDFRQKGRDVGECAVFARRAARGAREQLVPRGEARAFAIHFDDQGGFVSGNGLRIGVPTGQLMHRVALRQDNPFLTIAQRVGNRVSPILQRARISFPDALLHGACKCSTVTQVELDVLPRFEFLAQPLSPALQVVYPAGNREREATEGLRGELRLPAVVAHGTHGDCVPVLRAFTTIEKDRGDGVVPVGKDVRFYGYALPDCPLRRKPAAIDPRRDVLNNDTDCAHAGALLPSGQFGSGRR